MLQRLTTAIGFTQARADRSALELVAQALTGELRLDAIDDATLAKIAQSAGRHGVLGLLAHPSFESGQLAARARHLRAKRFTLRATAALEAANVAHVVLKGVAAGARWADPTVRLQSDLDVLVTPGDLQHAGEVLQRAGVAGRKFMDGEHMHNAAFEPADKGGLLLELHHDLSSHHAYVADVPLLLSRRARAGDVWALQPEDDAVYLALHACTHALQRLAWLVDLEGLHRAKVDWVEAARRARASNIAMPVALAWHVTRELLCVPIPETAFAELGVSRSLRAIARGLLVASESSTGEVHQFFERLFRVALVSPFDVPGVLVRKIKAKREENAAYFG